MKRAGWVAAGGISLAGVIAACVGSDPALIDTASDAGGSTSSTSSTSSSTSSSGASGSSSSTSSSGSEPDSGPADAGPGDFSITVASPVVIDPGATLTLAITVTPGAGFADAVDLSLEGAPAGVAVVSDADGGDDAGSSSTLTIKADSSAAQSVVATAIVHAKGRVSQIEHTASVAIRVGHLLVATDTPMLWTVPADVTKIRIAAWGAGGGSGGGARNVLNGIYESGGRGGGGGYAQGDFVVTPNESFALSVATAGFGGTTPPSQPTYGGGGAGGGFTSVFTSTNPKLDAGASDPGAYFVIAAGGGGGGGGIFLDTTHVYNGGQGGGGGGLTGSNGSSSGGVGAGGTQTAGGFSAGNTVVSEQATSLQGANAPDTCGLANGSRQGTPGGGRGGACDRGGGGGGGWYGGGGGYSPGNNEPGYGGGGGSAYVSSSATNPITVGATGAVPPSTTSLYYGSSAAVGAPSIVGDSGVPGNSGRIVIVIPP